MSAEDLSDEPWIGYDDAVSVWMALITERDHLTRIIDTRHIHEPPFGVPVQSRLLTDDEVAGVKNKLTRVTEMAAMVMDRRREIAAAFTEKTL